MPLVHNKQLISKRRNGKYYKNSGFDIKQKKKHYATILKHFKLYSLKFEI